MRQSARTIKREEKQRKKRNERKQKNRESQNREYNFSSGDFRYPL